MIKRILDKLFLLCYSVFSCLKVFLIYPRNAGRDFIMSNLGPCLTKEQADEVRSEMIGNGVPVRFLYKGCNLSIQSGNTLRKGVNVMHQVVYWNFTNETIDKIEGYLGDDIRTIRG